MYSSGNPNKHMYDRMLLAWFGWLIAGSVRTKASSNLCRALVVSFLLMMEQELRILETQNTIYLGKYRIPT
jgi:hypothetical protein